MENKATPTFSFYILPLRDTLRDFLVSGPTETRMRPCEFKFFNSPGTAGTEDREIRLALDQPASHQPENIPGFSPCCFVLLGDR